MAKDKENEQEVQQQSLFGKVQNAVSNIQSTAEKATQFVERVEQAEPVEHDPNAKKVGGGLSKVEYDESGSPIFKEHEKTSTTTPGGLFEKTLNNITSSEEKAETTPSLFEKYGRKTSEETTDAIDQTCGFRHHYSYCSRR